MLQAAIAGTAAVALGCTLFLLWLLSLRLRDSSIVDLYWGCGFVLVAAIGLLHGQAPLPRQLLIFGLTALWGLRLSVYLAWRNLGHGEDRRYQAMRAQHGDAWSWRSLFIVFWLQGALIWVISLPLQVALSQPTPATLSGLDYAAAVVVLFGIGFESVADFQLAAFKSRAENRGKVMDRGLWRYTRHPNYFGDFVVWWGLYLFAVATGVGTWTILSPLLMATLLRRVSGVTLLESTMKQRPGYDDYIRRTSPFFPRRPRS